MNRRQGVGVDTRVGQLVDDVVLDRRFLETNDGSRATRGWRGQRRTGWPRDVARGGRRERGKTTQQVLPKGPKRVHDGVVFFVIVTLKASKKGGTLRRREDRSSCSVLFGFLHNDFVIISICAIRLIN